MPYLNLDDEFTEHPKVDGLSDGAFRLHVSGMRYCAKNTSDGIIPAARVDRLKPNYKPSQLNELLRGKVWHRGGDGITEPMADNDTIVAWFEERGREAAEWREHERFRDECRAAGHPDDEDCAEHGPVCCNRPHGGAE